MCQCSQKIKIAKQLAIIIIILSFCGCSLAIKNKELNQEQASKAWANFIHRSNESSNKIEPFRISASLKMVDPDETRIIQALLWGNSLEKGSCKIRLDLRAGIGVIIAKINEHGNELLFFLPKDNRAARSLDANLSNLGVPIPFSLCELSQILLAREAHVLFADSTITPEIASKPLVQKNKDDTPGVTFQIPYGAFKGRLLIGENGLPIMWQSDMVRNDDYADWVMTFNYSNQWGQGEMLKRLAINFPHAKKQITFNIKERATPDAYSDEQITLELPEGVKPAKLDYNWLKDSAK